jgi:superfamily I DNA/RNA helicase
MPSLRVRRTDAARLKRATRAAPCEPAADRLSSPDVLDPGAVTHDEQGWGHRLASLLEGDRADGELRERSLLYVAATRARDESAISWNGRRSDLLPAPPRNVLHA